jgi:hypothetical protein
MLALNIILLRLSNYDPSSPATYAAEWDEPSSYPSHLMFDYDNGTDPIGQSIINSYGGKMYGMHWLMDCDDFCGFKPSMNKIPVLINTFQRGPQESTWETVPHPSIEKFQWGGPENGFLDLFVDDESYVQQWRYTNTPDADMRAVQACIGQRKMYKAVVV